MFINNLKSKKSLKAILKIVAINTTIFVSLILFACSAFWLHDSIEDFDAFLAALNRGTLQQVEIELSIPGFTPLVNSAFNFGLSFSVGSRYTFANISAAGFNVIVRDCGTLFYSNKNLLNTAITYDKFVYEHNGLFGIRDIFNRVIVPANFTDIKIFDSASFLVNDKVVDFYLNPLTVQSFPNATVVGKIDSLGFRAIYYNGLFGFANLASGVYFSPSFLEVSALGFNRYGFTAANLECGKYVIIDSSGAVVVEETSGKLPLNFNGEFITFLDTNSANLLGVADINFVPVTDRLFASIYDFAVWSGDIIIYNAPNMPQRFYSINHGDFLLGHYYSITATKNHFIAQSLNGRYSFYTATLHNIIHDKPFIAFNGAVLTVEYRGALFYFRAECIE